MCRPTVSGINRSQSRVSSAVAGRALIGPSLCGVFAWGRGRPRELARREGAPRVALAAVEQRAASAAATDELALAAVGAGDAGLLLRLFYVPAGRIGRAPHG